MAGGGVVQLIPCAAQNLPADRPCLRPVQGLPVAAVLCLTFGASLAAPPGVSAQTIAGVVLEREGEREIDGALVTLLTLSGDSVESALTDAWGSFEVSAPEAGEYLLAASAWGFETTIASSVFTLDRDGRMEVEFRIPRAPIEIEGINVLADPAVVREHKLVKNGFVERARLGFGRFLGPVDIEESAAYSTTDLLTRSGRVDAISRFGGDRILMRGARGPCVPHVYVDGIRVSVGEFSLDSFVPLSRLQGVEVYRSPVEAPPQYAVGLLYCGVVVLWTKAP